MTHAELTKRTFYSNIRWKWLPGGTLTCFTPQTIADTSPSSTQPELLLPLLDNRFGVRELKCSVWFRRLAASDNQSSGMSFRHSEISVIELPVAVATDEPSCMPFAGFPLSPALYLTAHTHTRTYLTLSFCISLRINGHFPGEPGLSSFTETEDDGSGSDNWSYKTCKAPVKLSLPTNQRPTFIRPDALPVAHPC